MSRLDYWRKQAQEAEADFYRLNAEQDQEDQAITALVDLFHASHQVQRALMDLIHASRQVERLSDPELPAWIYGKG
jgi:hypothetical protein